MIHTDVTPAEWADRLAIRGEGSEPTQVDGAWLLAERNLYVDLIETKPSRPS